MELAREARHEIVAATLEAVGPDDSDNGNGNDSVDAGHPLQLDSETATMILRRCTALAARARVDLLSPSRCGAADELVDLLVQMESWDPVTLETPDPTMTVLAAAALQDLAERLHLAQQRQEPNPSALTTSTDAVLGVLQGIMARARVDIPA
ncbi:MAG: hypothetical protein ACTHV2_03020 [Brachybacterium sp.]|uniref:hypothetical protein n=1 Tax=Brachybacterium sp. TaxID=1891286 RepID=UPI0026563DE4|nr:hypothetical protein [Brachybacterium sp.]MDN6328168.1 hypothetical protein [Brachybacterium sp.]MDN6399602.1 hypothetical protein [Brachybacterium sp.]